MSKASLARKGLKYGRKAAKSVATFGQRARKSASGAVKPGGALAGVGKPLAYGAALTVPIVAFGNAAAKKGRADNPPLQEKRIDTDGDGTPDATALFDTKTGKPYFYGDVPVEGDPERSQEEIWKWAIGGAALVALAIALLRGR